MSYLALYRKWRPRTFSEVVGQKHISVPLCNALIQNKVAHAYLFSGPRGTGKTSMAKILAKAVNCLNPENSNPCNNCPNCNEINQGNSLDVYEIDAASNRGIEEIRALKESVCSLPATCRKKVYIIDEVHMLTKEAFNALLKTLEEPPSYIMFILATTEPEKIPLTILSRCQRYEFRRISVDAIKEHLLNISKKSNFHLTEDAAALIAVRADGGLRDALSLLDQCSHANDSNSLNADDVYKLIGITNTEQILKLSEYIAIHDSGKILMLFFDLMQSGKEPISILRNLLEHYRNLMLYKINPNAPELTIYKSYENTLKKLSNLTSESYLDIMFSELCTYITSIKQGSSPRITAEMGLLHLSRVKEIKNYNDIHSRLAKIEEEISDLQKNGKIINNSSNINNSSKAEAETEIPANVKKSTIKTSTDKTSLKSQVEEHNNETVTESSVISPNEYDSIWKKTLDYFMSIKRIDIYSCFQKCNIVRLTNTNVTISAPQQFLVLACNNPSYKKAVSDALKNIIGYNIEVHTVLKGSPEETSALNSISVKKNDSQYNLIQKSDIPEKDKANPTLSTALKFLSDYDIYEKD